MSDKSAETKSGGIGFLGLLTILFIGLKLTNYIDWSWWWVLAPMWLPVAVVLGFFIGLKLTNYIDWSWWWVLAPMWLPIAVVLGIMAVVMAIGAAIGR